MSRTTSRSLFDGVGAFLLILSLFSEVVTGATLQMRFVDAKGAPVADAVVEVVKPPLPRPNNWPMRGTMDQIDKEFVEALILVVRGSAVSFPNKDNIHHHVYSFSDAKTFELPLFKSNDAKPVIFDKPGVVAVGCNVHDWMQGFIYIGETHLMAKSDSTGHASIVGLPAGDYQVRIWHARAKPDDVTQLRSARATEDETSVVTVTLALSRDRRIRRAPTGDARAY